MPDKKHLEAIAQFIREHRNSEGHFQLLYEKLMAEQQAAQQERTAAENSYAASLAEIMEKQASLYQQKKEKGISAWPEFEAFVSHFEKAVLQALHAA